MSLVLSGTFVLVKYLVKERSFYYKRNMPRPRSKSRNALIENAMVHFWTHGYEASSMGDLVTETGVSRSAIYSEFGGKRELFLACLEYYKENTISPSISIVEKKGADLNSIEAFLNTHISSVKRGGLPIKGCLFGNTLTEVAAHDAEISLVVRAHYDRLTHTFAKALANEVEITEPNEAITSLARSLTISVQGLWAYARCISDWEELQLQTDMLITLVKTQLFAKNVQLLK